MGGGTRVREGRAWVVEYVGDGKGKSFRRRAPPKGRNAPYCAAGYQRRKPAYRSPIPGFYICNTSQIYPEDRGTNYNVRIARECVEVLDGDAAELTRCQP